MVRFGRAVESSRFFLGYDGKLWRMHEEKQIRLRSDSDEASHSKSETEWISRLTGPRLELSVWSTDPGHWERTNECKFRIDAIDGVAWLGWRGEPDVVFRAWLENVQHTLIRLQRWVRRVAGGWTGRAAAGCAEWFRLL